MGGTDSRMNYEYRQTHRPNQLILNKLIANSVDTKALNINGIPFSQDGGKVAAIAGADVTPGPVAIIDVDESSAPRVEPFSGSTDPRDLFGIVTVGAAAGMPVEVNTAGSAEWDTSSFASADGCKLYVVNGQLTNIVPSTGFVVEIGRTTTELTNGWLYLHLPSLHPLMVVANSVDGDIPWSAESQPIVTISLPVAGKYLLQYNASIISPVNTPFFTSLRVGETSIRYSTQYHNITYLSGSSVSLSCTCEYVATEPTTVGLYVTSGGTTGYIQRRDFPVSSQTPEMSSSIMAILL